MLANPSLPWTPCVRADLARGVYRTYQYAGRSIFIAVTSGGDVLDERRRRLGEDEEELVDALYDLLDVADPLGVVRPAPIPRFTVLQGGLTASARPTSSRPRAQPRRVSRRRARGAGRASG